MNEVMTAQEVAEYLGLAVETIYRKARAGEIPAMRIGRRWRFVREALEAWVRGETQVPETRRPLSRDELPKFRVYNAGTMKGTLRRVEIYDDE